MANARDAGFGDKMACDGATCLETYLKTSRSGHSTYKSLLHAARIKYRHG
jgi:hypothetical protein